MFNIHKGLPVWRTLSLIVVVTFGILTILGTGNEEAFFDPQDIADAGPDQHASIADTVFLDGSGSNTALGANPGDNNVIYRWEILQTPEGVPLSGAGAPFWETDPGLINPAFIPGYYPGEYIIQLTVKLNGQTGLDSVKITTYSEREDILPSANAGMDIITKHGALVDLNASRSFNFIVSSPFTYNWYMTESPLDSTSVLSSTVAAKPTFIAEFNENDNGAGVSHYQARLHVINENSLSSLPDHVDIYVYPTEGYAHPIPMAGPDQNVTTSAQVNLDGSGSYDVDDRPLSYEWQFYSRPFGSLAALSNANTATPFFTPDVDGTYVLFVSVNNGELSSSSNQAYDWQYQDRVKVNATSGFSDPVPILGPDQLIHYIGPDSLTLDASRSTPTNQHTYYGWWLSNKPAMSIATIDITDHLAADGARLNYDMEGDYVVKMGTDNHDHADRDTIVYQVTSNTPPVADAGADQNVTANFLVTLNGSASSDADQGSLAYSWSLVSTPVGWTSWPGDWPRLSEGRDANPDFTPTLNGEYQLRLTVNDNELSSVTDEVIITVSGSAANSAPTADAGVDQSVTVGDTVLLDGGGSSDPDNDTLIYNWTLDTRPSGSSAAIEVLSRETASFNADVEGSYEVQLIVNDRLLNSNPDTMTVTAAVAGACANPLALITDLPFAPGAEMATNIQVDAEGIDTLSVITADAPVDSVVYQARIPDPSNLDQAEFVILLPTVWEEINRTYANPISDTDSPSFIVRNIADNMYYKLDVDFTGTDMLEVQIDALSGCRCGSNAGDCP